MTQSDPEARIAELERELANARAAVRPDNNVTQPIRHAVAWQPIRSSGGGRGRKNALLWSVALLPVFLPITFAFGFVGLIVALVVVGVVVVSHVVLTRRGLDGETIIGGIIGVLGGALGGVTAVVAVLLTQFPSSVLWMSGIVCSSPYHLEYDVSHYSVRPGESFSSADFACVSGENAYAVGDLEVWGLQGLLVTVALCPVLAVGYFVWRRVRTHR